MKKNKIIRFTVILFLFLIAATIPDEGMYPIMNISKLDLTKAGLKISPDDIYNPKGVSIIDALVNIGGCTASFISEDGLMITNHHCGFGAISRASTPEHNYLENGFVAMTRNEEIPAQGYTARIMESYEDVSDIILSSVKNISDLAERSKAIDAKMRELAKNAEDPNNSITAAVSEMFIGQTYILFKYKTISDVRLVYAPPRSIGEFGGETDNWVWPRHTGDFTFMRAYVAPNGKSAPYSKDNIPFKPKKWLKVNPNGVQENDFVFILGYPGRTFRHMPAQFIQYQEEFLMPFTADLYDFMIKQMEEIAGDDDALKLKYAPNIKGLANTMKNYRGKLLGLKRIKLVNKKYEEEKLLNKFIQSNPDLNKKYGNLLSDINDVYVKMMSQAEADLWLSRFTRFSTSARFAQSLFTYAAEFEKPEAQRKDFLKKRDALKTVLDGFDYEMESRLLVKMLTDAQNFSTDIKVDAVEDYLADTDPEEFANQILANEIYSKEKLELLYSKTTKDLLSMKNPVLNFFYKIKKQYEVITAENERLDGALSKLMPMFNEVKKEWKQTSFIPDANGTLRLTYGYVKGYAPRDAVYYNPLTTLDGVIEKSMMSDEYQIPEQLYDLYKKKDYGRFADKKTGSIPVAILYNMDTTGGNSGSPILNAYGEIIGVNFDRAYEATINDYAWNESYSRSIGVDIRYVLWVTSKIGGANHLLTEMGVSL